MSLKKRSKRSRIRGSRTCRHGSRKKRRGKGSKAGKGLAGTGKRAGHMVTYIFKHFGKYLGSKGFTSRKKIKRKKLPVKNIDSVINSGRYYVDDILVLEDTKLVGSKSSGLISALKSLGITKISCFDMSKKLKDFLEKNGIQVITKRQRPTHQGEKEEKKEEKE